MAKKNLTDAATNGSGNPSANKEHNVNIRFVSPVQDRERMALNT